MLPYLMTAGGFVLLFAGGEALVRGAVGISQRLNLSQMLIGLTVVAFGTSAPELLVSVSSALRGQPDIAVGNVIGSNICNIALILGLSAAVKPVFIDKDDVRFDIWVMIAATFAITALSFTGIIERWQGALLVAALATYIVVSYRREIRRGTSEADWQAESVNEFEKVPAVGLATVFVLVGVGALVLGADWLVKGAVAIAEILEVNPRIVALSVVALGTSLPELATSVIAAYRGHSDVAVGNVLGSNLFNILSILGLTSIVAPISVSPAMVRFDLPVMVALTLIAAALLLWRGRVGRISGWAFLLGYAAYIAALYIMV
jgi:cation:H+ antiporter